MCLERRAVVWVIAVLVGGVTAVGSAWAMDPATQPASQPAEKPVDFRQLQRQLYQAYRAHDYARALGIAEKMHAQKPDDVQTLYNLACLTCLLGQKEKAYEWLDRAVEAGFRDVDRLVRDDDLKTIRAEDRFRAIVRRLRAIREGVAPPKGSDRPEFPTRPREPTRPEPPTKPAEAEKPGKPEEPEKPGKPPAREELSPAQAQARVMELTDKLIAASKAGKNEEALKLALEARQLADLWLTNYNVACMYSRLNKKDEAFEYLDRAIEQAAAGEEMVNRIEEDPDFDNLRKDPRYPKALEKAGRSDGKKPSPPAHSEKPADPEKPAEPEKPAAPVTPATPTPSEQARINELTRRMMRAAEAGEVEQALKLALEAHSIGDIGLTNYNVACMYARLGKKDEAFKYLERAIALGGFPTDLARHMEGDSDLDSLRDDPRYAAALKKAGGGHVPEGAGVQCLVLTPRKHDPSRPAPLLVVLHGANSTMRAVADQWIDAADKAGAILLAPQGPVAAGEGRFGWGDDLAAIESCVMDAVNVAMDQHRVDADRVIIAGVEAGATAAWGVALRNPDAFRGVIALGGEFDSRLRTRLDDEDVAKWRCYILTSDRQAVLEGYQKAAEKLKDRGGTVELKTVKGRLPRNLAKELTPAVKFVLGD